MIRLRGTIEYEGGRVQEFEAGTAALADWELYALRHGYPIGEGAPATLASLVIAHSVLGIDEGFDVWRRSVVGVEMEASGAVVPPTLPVASGGP